MAEKIKKDNKVSDENYSKSNKKVVDGIIKKIQKTFLLIKLKKGKKEEKFLMNKDTVISEIVLSSNMKLVSEKKINLKSLKVNNSVSLIVSKGKNNLIEAIRKISVKE